MKYLLIIFMSLKVFSFDHYPDPIKPRKYNLKESNSLALAKEMCSCLFVSNQSESYCKTVTEESLFLGDYKINSDEKYVKAWTISKEWKYRAFAYYDQKNPQFGCQLTKAQQYSRIFKGWHDLTDIDNYNLISKLERKIRNNQSFQPVSIKIERDQDEEPSIYTREK